MISSRQPRAAGRSVDSRLLGLLPWLASRFDLSEGAFRGEGSECDATPAFRAAQGRAILQALGVYPLLPHVVRIKLERWPAINKALLDDSAAESPLARAMLDALPGSADDLGAALSPFSSPDFGYTLVPLSGEPGSLAAAHHLLVVARPRWFSRRGLVLPRVSAVEVADLNERLLAAQAP